MKTCVEDYHRIDSHLIRNWIFWVVERERLKKSRKTFETSQIVRGLFFRNFPRFHLPDFLSLFLPSPFTFYQPFDIGCAFLPCGKNFDIYWISFEYLFKCLSMFFKLSLIISKTSQQLRMKIYREKISLNKKLLAWFHSNRLPLIMNRSDIEFHLEEKICQKQNIEWMKLVLNFIAAHEIVLSKKKTKRLK